MATIFEVPNNMTNVAEILPFANDVTQGGLGLLILILIGAVTFIITSSFSPKQGFVATGFIISMTAVFLWLLEVITGSFMWTIIIVFAVLLALSVGVKGTTA